MRVATVARRQGSKAALAPVSVKRYLLANGLADLIGFEDALGENAHPTWSVSALVDAACAQVAFTTVLNLWGPHRTASPSSGEGENVSKSACGNEKVGTLIGPELCSTVNSSVHSQGKNAGFSLDKGYLTLSKLFFRKFWAC